MRFVAIDLGDKRTGLALGDDQTRLATPTGLVEVPLADRAGEALLDALSRELESLVGRAPATLVVGLPLNADGTESARSKLTRAFAERVAARTERPVVFHEERHTTDAAHARMAQTGLTHKQKKNRRDAIAAQVILQRYLDTLPNSDDGTDLWESTGQAGPNDPNTPPHADPGANRLPENRVDDW
jgi:putative Holliday junction resolvase